MSWIPDRYRELRTLLRPERIEDEVDEELALHVELRAADLEAAGLTRTAALQEAQRRFGDPATYRARTCAIDESIRRERRRMELMDAVRRETRHALRSLMRAPLFTVVAVVTLGLGIGATTAIYTLLDAIVFRPLPYPAADRLVQINHAVPRVQEGLEWGNSAVSYFYYGDESGSFEELGAFTRASFAVSGDGDAERIDGALVSASLLRILGARAAHGRLITDEDDSPGADRVALISHELWQSRYQADVSVIGRTIQVHAAPVLVIGVLEPGFTLPDFATHIWLPLQLDRTREPVNSHMDFTTYGKLRPDVTPELAQQELARLMPTLADLFPGVYSPSWFESSGFMTRVHPLRSMVLGKAGSGRVGIDSVLWMLLGAVSLVLLIACANVANLMMVRAEARRRELTVRAALGAERAHLAVHYLSESLLLTAAAALTGLLLAHAGVQALLAFGPSTLPRLGGVSLGSNAALFALGVSLAAGLIFGLVPVIRSRPNFSELRESGRGMTPSRQRQFARNALVIGQVGMALVLLAAGSLMLRSFMNLRSVQSGVDSENVLTFTVSLPWVRYQEEEQVFRFHQDFVQRVSALAGVQTVGATASLPLAGAGHCSTTASEGAAFRGCLPTAFVLPGYFETLGIAVSGGTFTWGDLERRANGAIVSRALADRMWPGEDPIGRNIISYQDGPPWFRVIGVAENVLANGLDQPPIQVVYYPTRQPAGDGYWGPRSQRTMSFVVRTATAGTAAPGALAGPVRSILRDMDPEVPLADVRTMRDVIMSSERMARTTFAMMLLGIAAVVALFLSAVGLYGVIAYLVGRRRAEIGVRMALGARVTEVAQMVVMQSLRLTMVGILVGVAAALLVTRTLTSLVWGVEPTDPVTLLGVSALLLVVAIIASALPARRAAQTDPSEALRAD